jgi:hypothetical protein
MPNCKISENFLQTGENTLNMHVQTENPYMCFQRKILYDSLMLPESNSSLTAPGAGLARWLLLTILLLGEAADGESWLRSTVLVGELKHK